MEVREDLTQLKTEAKFGSEDTKMMRKQMAEIKK